MNFNLSLSIFKDLQAAHMFAQDLRKTALKQHIYDTSESTVTFTPLFIVAKLTAIFKELKKSKKNVCNVCKRFKLANLLLPVKPAVKRCGCLFT